MGVGRGWRWQWAGGLLGLGAIAAVDAGTVYRWVDATGAVHFSDQPPPQEVRESEQLELPPTTAPAGTVEDYYSVINQARRMEERRLQAQRQRAEIEALERQAESSAAPAPAGPAGDDGDDDGPPLWVLSPGYWGRERWHEHRPPGWSEWPKPPHPPRPPGHRPSPDGPHARPHQPSFEVDLPRR
jgi:hypothetical protein